MFLKIDTFKSKLSVGRFSLTLFFFFFFLKLGDGGNLKFDPLKKFEHFIRNDFPGGSSH